MDANASHSPPYEHTFVIYSMKVFGAIFSYIMVLLPARLTSLLTSQNGHQIQERCGAAALMGCGCRKPLPSTFFVLSERPLEALTAHVWAEAEIPPSAG